MTRHENGGGVARASEDTQHTCVDWDKTSSTAIAIVLGVMINTTSTQYKRCSSTGEMGIRQRE
jgi:hypothetical protein